MVDGTPNIPPNLIAEWIQYVAAFVVAVIVGLSARFGWTNAKDLKPDKTMTQNVEANEKLNKALIESIEHLNNQILQANEDSARYHKRQAETLSDLSADLRKLNRTTEDIFGKMKN